MLTSRHIPGAKRLPHPSSGQRSAPASIARPSAASAWRKPRPVWISMQLLGGARGAAAALVNGSPSRHTSWSRSISTTTSSARRLVRPPTGQSRAPQHSRARYRSIIRATGSGYLHMPAPAPPPQRMPCRLSSSLPSRDGSPEILGAPETVAATCEEPVAIFGLLQLRARLNLESQRMA